MAKAYVVLGRDLSPEEIRLINHYRKLEFNSQNPIAPNPDNDDWQKPYFLLRDRDDLVAFGRLHSIDVEFRETRYEILGIATIIAIIKGSGFGRELMNEIKLYVNQSGKTAIGFCDPKVSGFYEKCGYSILQEGMSHFDFSVQDRRIAPPHPHDYVLYLDGRDRLMQAIHRYPKEKVTAYRPAW
jgi:hypothetical protein